MNFIIFENKYTKFQIPFSEILYFETSEIPHKINLVTSKKNISFALSKKKNNKFKNI